MRLIDADALIERMKNTWDMQELYLPVHFADFVEDQPTVNQWISVEDRLPKAKPDDLEYPAVIIALPDGSVEMGCYYESTHEWGAGENFDRPREPIAWMPLPEQPEEVKQE